MLNKKFVFAVSLVAMMAVSNAWASEPATGETVSTKHSVFTAYTPTEAGSKAGIAGVTYVNRAVNSAGNAATAAEIHAAASGAYAIDAKTAAEQANSAAAAAQAASAAAQETASEGVNKAKAAQQTADTANATANKNKTDIASIMTEQATQNTNISNLQTAVAGKQGTLKAGTNISISDDNTISSTYTYTLPTATDDVAGGMKLYTASGTATDGTMTQKAITDLVDLETGNVLEEAQGIVDNLETRVNANTTNISNLQTTVAGKQATLSEAQLAAVNSGITKTKVETYDGYSALITNAQNTANSKLATATYDTQVGTVSATNMGTEATTVVGGIKEAVTEAAAAQSTANTANATANNNKTDIASIKTEQATQNTNISNLQTAVAGKQGTLSEAQLAAVNSGITKTKVETYDGYSALITNAQNTADSKLATATYNTQVGTVSATNMGTEATTVVGGIKEAVTEAAAAQSTANTANATANNNKTDIASIKTEQATQNTNISNLQTAVAGKQGTLKAGANISISDDNTISSTYTYTLPTATDDVAGGMKLYTASGTATDGTMTQKAITDLVDLETNDVLEEAQGIVNNLETRVNTNETNISNLQTTVAGKQGTLKAGTNISISADNTISSTYTYTLPTATASVKGGVTIGSNIGVSSGKISVADATATTKGVSVLGVIPSGGTGSAATGTATIWVE